MEKKYEKVCGIVDNGSCYAGHNTCYGSLRGGPQKQNSGIKGTATLGPLNPVSRQGEPNDKPYARAIIIVKNASGAEAARTTTADEGSFSAALSEGNYMVEGTNPEGAMLPYAAAFGVKVEKEHIRWKKKR